MRARPLAAGFALLVGVTLSSAASAVAFTLQELFDGASFRVGSTEFRSWSPIPGSTVDPNSVLVEAIQISDQVGFAITGDFTGDGTLIYDFEVVPGLFLSAATLSLTQTVISTSGPFDLQIVVRECAGGQPPACLPPPDPRPNLSVQLSNSTVRLFDADTFAPFQQPQNPFLVRSEFAQTSSDEGALATSGYTTLFTVVPEPRTALLLGLGLTGLAVLGRSRVDRARSRCSASSGASIDC